MSTHYSTSLQLTFSCIEIHIGTGLASGKLIHQVPFEQVERDTARFVASEYRPTNVIIKDPRNMPKNDIALLLRHVYERQNNVGCENAFRFKIYLGRDKQDVVAKYPRPSVYSGRPATNSPQPSNIRPAVAMAAAMESIHGLEGQMDTAPVPAQAQRKMGTRSRTAGNTAAAAKARKR